MSRVVCGVPLSLVAMGWMLMPEAVFIHSLPWKHIV